MINSNREKYKAFSNELSGDMVFKCNMKNCNKFYHLKCLFCEEYNGRFADKAGKVIRSIKEKSIVFRCPAHYCFVCYIKDPQSCKSRPVSCSVCSMTIHLKCMKDDQFKKLRKNTYICQSHLTEDKLRLVEEFYLFNEKKIVDKKKVAP